MSFHHPGGFVAEVFGQFDTIHYIPRGKSATAECHTDACHSSLLWGPIQGLHVSSCHPIPTRLSPRRIESQFRCRLSRASTSKHVGGRDVLPCLLVAWSSSSLFSDELI